MSAVTALCVMVALLFAALAWLAIWSRWADRGRLVAVALFLLGLPMLAFAGLESLSWSRPLWAMHGLRGEVRILGAKMIKDEAIYAYVDTGEGEPRAVALPWSTETAKQLQDVFDDPKNGGQAMMRFDWSWDTRKEPNFYPLPQPTLPMPKEPQPAAPHMEL